VNWQILHRKFGLPLVWKRRKFYGFKHQNKRWTGGKNNKKERILPIKPCEGDVVLSIRCGKIPMDL
jgi:hypothetical protein